MVGQNVLNAYRKMERQAEIHPVKLIHMLYERALDHLELAEEGIREQVPGKRGENISKAIAIVSELNASIKSDDHSEAARFLRGLYEAILLELPKVSVSQDLKVLRQAHTYLARLKSIWEQTAMVELAGREHGGKAVDYDNAAAAMAELERPQPPVRMAAGGLSVSI
jgi:flagellar secretion chaperone FliS